jgi:hypothetical protein
MTAAARYAGAAAVEREHDVIALRDLGHTGAERLDHTRALVPGDDRKRRERGELGRARHHVGVAHARRDDADEDLARSRTGELKRFDRVGLVALTQHRGSDLHDRPPRSRSRRRFQGSRRSSGAQRLTPRYISMPVPLVNWRTSK